MPIEQAIFTSQRTARAQGYQIVAASAGLSDADAREIAGRSPSHGSLVDPGPLATSTACYRLASGSYCVSRTSAAGEEYSGRGGYRVYTQNFVVPPETLAQFANNPMALTKAALAKGVLDVIELPVQQLPSVNLVGRAAAVDEGLLQNLPRTLPGGDPRALVALVDAVLSTSLLAVVGGAACDSVFGAVLNCLPLGCRAELSFSTGMVYSPRRPFRLMGVGGDEAEIRRLRRQGIDVFDFKQADAYTPQSTWAAFLSEVIESQDWPRLAAVVQRAGASVTLGGLNAWAIGALSEESSSHSASATAVATEASTASCTRRAATTVAHGAHAAAPPKLTAAEPLRSVESSPAPSVRRPSTQLTTADGPALEKLEALDDLVFEAIRGNADSVPLLRALWPTLHGQFGPEVLEESREQYLRYALQLWEASAGETTRDATRAAAALDVLCVLFER